MSYEAPVRAIVSTLHDIAGFSAFLEQGLAGELDRETTDSILEEAARFARERLAPLNQPGDAEGARLENGSVRVPSGWTEAYRDWIAAGWGALAGPRSYGGLELPVALQMAVQEIWNSANLAFGLNPLLTQGAVEALSAHGSQALKDTYLPKLVTGEWSGTMELTEPHAGSDLRFLRTRAEPQPDGSYRITGTKIFITFGEHEMTENIIHFVLARLPDAPPGIMGISLFLAPKYLPKQDGSLGERNDIVCSKLEHKLGIHGSPTCVLNYGDHGGAVAWLVGEPHRGLKAMFTMMNRARLAVGVQGVAIAERAYQKALAYAKERRQGHAADIASGDMLPIICHPDVRRMLLGMKAKTAAARAVCYATAAALDRSFRSPDEAERTRAASEAALLTPIAKAFSTDIAVEVASEGIQVHGGMGFVEETGAAQYLRDARILPIYEGTNGIQAIDLVMRKLPMEGGLVAARLLAGLRGIVASASESNDASLNSIAKNVGEALDRVEQTGAWLLNTLPHEPNKALAGATAFTRMAGLAVGGAYLARGGLSALREEEDTGNPPAGRLIIARHFAETMVPHCAALQRSIMDGHETVLASYPDFAL